MNFSNKAKPHSLDSVFQYSFSKHWLSIFSILGVWEQLWTEEWMDKAQCLPSGGSRSSGQNCALRGPRWSVCWKRTLPSPGFFSEHFPVGANMKLWLKAGKGSGWSRRRQEEWLGRKAAFQVEEMEGAKSGSKREHDPLWNSWSDAQT